MNNERHDAARVSSCVSARALAGLAGLLCCASALAETDFSPYLGLDLIWLNNPDLAPESTREEYVGQVTPGLRVSQEGRRLNGYLNYEAQALYFQDDSERNDVYHNADLTGDFMAVEDWFFVGVDGSYYQSTIDPEQPVNQNNLFDVGNITDTAAGRVTPALRHEFNSATLDAFYSLGFVDYRGDLGAAGELDDSRNEEGGFELSSADLEAPLTWGTRYRYEHVEYDISLPFEYERADAEIGVRVAPGLRLLGRGGIESDPLDPSLDGGLEESFWDAGVLWQRGNRAEVLVRAGQRFFGTSYEALVRLRGRVLWLDVGYDELPTTETQRAAMRDVQPPDVAAPLPPEQLPFGRPGSDVYLLKRLHGLIGAVGRYTRVGLEFSSEDREYIRLDGIEDNVLTGRFFLSRQFGQHTQGELSASAIDADLRNGASYKESIYTLEFTREISVRTLASFTANHVRRTSTFPYDSTWISLGLLMTFL